MIDNLSGLCLNLGITNCVEIKLTEAQLCWGGLAWKGNKGIPKCIPFRDAKIGRFSPSGQRKYFKDIQKHTPRGKKDAKKNQLRILSKGMMDAYMLKAKMPKKRRDGC